MIAPRLLAVLVVGLPLSFAACGGANLTLPGEGEPAHIAVTAGSPQSGRVGTQLGAPLVVKVTDTQDRPVPGVTVTFTFDDASSGATVLPASNLTNASGQASTTITLGTRVGAVNGHATVSGSQGGTPVQAAFTATALPGNASLVEVVSGDGQSGSVGSTLGLPLVVQVTDPSSNPIPGITITWTVDGGGSVSETSTVTGDNGQTQVTRKLGTATGHPTTKATAADLPGEPSVTFTHEAKPGAAVSLIKISGDVGAAPAGSVVTLGVEVQDADGNPVSGASVTWLVGEGNGTASPRTNTTNGQGQATTQWTLGPVPGTNTLNVVSTGGATTKFTISGTGTGSPSTLAVTTQPPSSVTAGVTLTPGPVVQIQDASGNNVAVPGVDITVGLTNGGGTLEGTQTLATDANGSAQFSDLRITGATGSRRLIFAADGYRSAKSNSFVVSPANNPPTAAFTAPACTPGVPCQFTDESSDTDGNIVGRLWEFGDGASSTEKDPVHIYALAGTYEVKLTVTDNAGASNTAQHSVTANHVPVANPDAYSTPAAVPLSVGVENGVLQNDIDADVPPDVLTATLVTDVSSGTLTFDPRGSFDYMPAPTATSGDMVTFTYKVQDLHGGVSNTTTVTITIQ